MLRTVSSYCALFTVPRDQVAKLSESSPRRWVSFFWGKTIYNTEIHSGCRTWEMLASEQIFYAWGRYFSKIPLPNMIHLFNYTEYHSEELLSKLYHFVFFSINYGIFTNVTRIKVGQNKKESKICIGLLCPVLVELYYLYHKGSFHLILIISCLLCLSDGV